MLLLIFSFALEEKGKNPHMNANEEALGTKDICEISDWKYSSASDEHNDSKMQVLEKSKPKSKDRKYSLSFRCP